MSEDLFCRGEGVGIPELVEMLNSALKRIEALEAQLPKRKSKAAEDATAPTGKLVWDSYASAFRIRYKTDPVRNAKVNGQIAQFVARVGVDAPSIAQFFVLQCGSQWYVQRMHSIDMLLRDAETVAVAWKRGRGVTATEARLSDQTTQRSDAWAGVMARASLENAARSRS
jgi:hypothetical protein